MLNSGLYIVLHFEFSLAEGQKLGFWMKLSAEMLCLKLKPQADDENIPSLTLTIYR